MCVLRISGVALEVCELSDPLSREQHLPRIVLEVDVKTCNRFRGALRALAPGQMSRNRSEIDC